MVRSKLTVILQEPVLFPGTTRENITAFKSLDDDMVLRALEKVKLKGHVMAHGGLDAKMDDLPLSAGQRQLICLAQAIMKQTILLLDEVTSRVDDTTDRLMQQVIRQEFSGCTFMRLHIELILSWTMIELLLSTTAKSLNMIPRLPYLSKSLHLFQTAL